ncbi:MAG: glycoside hydrolase family 66 protein [Devosia sp.]|nr:glycoside hydrolase family 66 protein [Devosia sp.]
MTISILRELLPRLATFKPSGQIEIEVRGIAAPGTVTVWHLGDRIAELAYDGNGALSVPPLLPGGYGIELDCDGEVFRTAVEVAEDLRARLRYGFVASYAPDRELQGVRDTVRRLHLTGVQFYDWAYRHADLMGGGESYRDALDQPVSLEIVRSLVHMVKTAGCRALGYAAVYAVGPKEWGLWNHRALLKGAGEAYGLGDFLLLVDPAAEDWLTHFIGDLERATEALGFDGFHLDQYGYPKQAVRADGAVVDVGASFAALIEAARIALPGSHLVFNNVNDFPTWRTATSPQDAVYVEPWEPQLTLDSLARTVSRARSLSGGKPVVVAAYQHVYDKAESAEADRATALTMAALYSHGATQLLAGEGDRILVDPYYVRNHVVEPSTAAMLKRWYDFLVAHDSLLLAPEIVDVTTSYVGAYNGDLDVSFADAGITETATAGSVWRRVTEVGGRMIVHLINLVGQPDTLWDAPRASPGNPGAARLTIRRIDGFVPRVAIADPDGIGRLTDVPVTMEGPNAIADLPPLSIWQMVVVDLTGRRTA